MSQLHVLHNIKVNGTLLEGAIGSVQQLTNTSVKTIRIEHNNYNVQKRMQHIWDFVGTSEYKFRVHADIEGQYDQLDASVHMSSISNGKYGYSTFVVHSMKVIEATCISIIQQEMEHYVSVHGCTPKFGLLSPTFYKRVCEEARMYGEGSKAVTSVLGVDVMPVPYSVSSMNHEDIVLGVYEDYL